MRTLSVLTMTMVLVLSPVLAPVLAANAGQVASANAEGSTMHHAHGTFTVKMGAPTTGPVEGFSTFTMDKEFQGSFEGKGHGEMFAGGDYTKGVAGYVAVERLTGKLDGKAGSFALQHTATMKGKDLAMEVVVTPGSGTGELEGIEGTFKITVKDGQHSYELDYELPTGS